MVEVLRDQVTHGVRDHIRCGALECLAGELRVAIRGIGNAVWARGRVACVLNGSVHQCRRPLRVTGKRAAVANRLRDPVGAARAGSLGDLREKLGWKQV